VEDARLPGPGIPSQCWLKGGLPLGRVPKDGVISGVPFEQLQPGDLTAVRTVAAGLQPGDLTAVRDVAIRSTLRASAEPLGDRVVPWGQCGGHFWSGPTQCQEGWRCKVRSELYAQCMPPTGSSALSIPDVDKKLANLYVHVAITKAFGGKGVSADALCPRFPSPSKGEEATDTDTEGIIKEATAFATMQQQQEQISAAPSPGPSAEQAPAALVVHSDMLWFGCFRHPPNSEYIYSNEQAGFTTELCLEGCTGFDFALLHNDGHCSCGSDDPRESHFEEVPAATCGDVCPEEAELRPKRYCGGYQTFAVYLSPS